MDTQCGICKKAITPNDYLIPYGISLCYCDWKNVCRKCYNRLVRGKKDGKRKKDDTKI